MVAYNQHPAKKSFILKVVGPNDFAKELSLVEGTYTVGSDKNADICLPKGTVSDKYASVTLSNGNLVLTRFSDNKVYKTQYEKNEWIKCEEYYIQIPLRPENTNSYETDAKTRTQLSVVQTNSKATLPPAPHKAVREKSSENKERYSVKRKPTSDNVDIKFDESSFEITPDVPIEVNADRFKNYIDVNDKTIRTILPNKKKAKSQVLEIMYISYGNIVNFEFLPMQQKYINHLYSFVSRDLKKLLPEERNWISWKGSGPTFSVPHGWNKVKTNNNNLYNKNADFKIYKGVNQIVVRQAQGLPGFILWLTWPGRKEFTSFVKIASLFFLPFMILSLFTLPERVKEQEVVEEVVILKPELIKTPEPTPTPEPTKVAEVKPTPKPTPAPKVVEKPQPKPIEKPKPKVVVDIQPPKRLVVAKGPVKTGGSGPPNPRAAEEAAARAQAQKLAQTKAKLSSSLGFISSGRGLLTVPDVPNQSNKFLGQRGLAGLKETAGKNFLAEVTGKNATGANSGPINTNGSRTIATGPVISDGEVHGSADGKDLNFVQGKVSMAGLHSAGGSGSFGPVGGMTTSGNIDQDAVRRAIEKYMSKIRYCYEKALLGKPSMSGSLRMEWKVNPGGRASGVKVVQSALNDATLHGCVSNVISTIPFPNPKGGPATVAYPFNFTPFN